MHIAADGNARLVFSTDTERLAGNDRQAVAAARERHVAVLLQLCPSRHQPEVSKGEWSMWAMARRGAASPDARSLSSQLDGLQTGTGPPDRQAGKRVLSNARFDKANRHGVQRFSVSTG